MPHVCPGSHHGDGDALEITMFGVAIALAPAELADVLGVNELATTPAKTRAKTETRTISFMTRLPPGAFLTRLGMNCNETEYSSSSR
jgi:hypothetical protein